MDGRVGRDASPWMQAGTFGQGIRGEGKQMVAKPFIRQKKKSLTLKKALINRALKKATIPRLLCFGGFSWWGGGEVRLFYDPILPQFCFS